MESQACIFLGFKVKPGPIERFKLDNYALNNTINSLKSEAEKKSNIPSSSLELIHHGKILKDNTTLQESGIKYGEMVHVVKKKEPPAPTPPPTYTDNDLQQINASLRTLGCTLNAPGWTRAIQLLNEESSMAEIIEAAPSLGEDCVALSILHEVELLAALGANIQTMRRGADAHPDLPAALRHLTQLVRARTAASTSTENIPTSGFAYSLEALSEDEDADDEETEESAERNPITQEQLAAALEAATEAVTATRSRSEDSLMRMLQAGETSRAPAAPSTAATTAATTAAATTAAATAAATSAGSPTTTTPAPVTPGGGRSLITTQMFNQAIAEAMVRAGTARAADAPMELSAVASSSQSPAVRDVPDFAAHLNHMKEMGLLNDELNLRALFISSGNVNEAINLVLSGAMEDL